jgi:hypothetical protein
MARQRRDVWVCDAPTCTVERPVDEDAPLGYSGLVSTQGGTGCRKEPWFACTDEHVGPAILNVARIAQQEAWNS